MKMKRFALINFFIVIHCICSGQENISKTPLLSLFNVPLRSEKAIERTIVPEDLKKECCALYVELQDFDSLKEGLIRVNGYDVKAPESCISDRDNMPGLVFLPRHILKDGKNNITFQRLGNEGGTSAGFAVYKAEFVFGKSQEEIQKRFSAAITEATRKEKKRRDQRKKANAWALDHARRQTPVKIRYQWEYQPKDSEEDSLPFWNVLSGSWGKTACGLRNLSHPGRSEVDLHVYGQETEFSGTFFLSGTNVGSSLWFVGRSSAPDWRVQIGYDWTSGKYRFCEYYPSRVTRDFSGPPLQPGRMYQFRMVFQKDTVRLEIDSRQILKVTGLRNCNYGRVGLIVENCAAVFENLKLVCEALPVQGIRSQIVGLSLENTKHFYVGNLNLLRLSPEQLLVHMRAPTPFGGIRCLKSTDNGNSWSLIKDPFKVDMDIGIEQLQDGKLLAAYRRRLGKGFNNTPSDILVRLSSDQGGKWSSPIKISLPGVNSVMNGKLVQTTSGRIFIPACLASGGEGEKTGGMMVYYSDDGVNWQASPQRLTLENTGMNLQEGQIVELSDGKLMMVMRTERPYLAASYSEDNGLSWSMPKPLPLPSVMCAFGVRRASDTGSIYCFWVYDDARQATRPQFPRERLALAVSHDDGRSWKYLADIDCFGGYAERFMNLGLFVEGRYLFLTSTVFRYNAKGQTAVKLWRVDRSKLLEYKEFPPLN